MITDINGNLLYGRIGFKNGEIFDFGETWWSQTRVQSKMQTLSIGNAKYGIRLVCMPISRFGDNYRISRFNAEFINPFLKTGVKFSFFPARFKEFHGLSHSRKVDLKKENFIEMDYFATIDMLEQVKDFKSDVFSLVYTTSTAFQTSTYLPISDILLSKLGATILESGEIRLGPNNQELEHLFRRIFGSDNDKLMKICRVFFNSKNEIRFLGRKSTGSQTTKQWFIELRAGLEGFASNYASNPPSADDLKNFKDMEEILDAYITQNIDWSKVKFSSGDKFSISDLKSAKIVADIMVNIFGSFSFEKMLTGQVLMKDGIVRFIGHPRTALYKIFKNVGLTLSEDRLFSRNHIDYSFSIDYFLTRKFITLPVDSSLNIDREAQQLTIPEVPDYYYAPYFKNPSRFSQMEYNLYLKVLSQDLLNDFYDWFTLSPPSQRKEGNSKAFNILLDIYKARIFARYETSFSWGLSDDEIINYRRAGLELLNYYLFAPTLNANPFKREFIDFLSTKGRGKREYILTIPIFGSSKPSNLLDGNNEEFYNIRLTAGDYYLFEDDATQILQSYNPIQDNDFSYKQSLKSQEEQITRIGRLFKNLANKYGKIRIYPYKSFSTGLGHWASPSNHDQKDKFMPSLIGSIQGKQRGEVYFEIDSSDFSNFDVGFMNFLGGLLVEKYTFIVKADGMADNEMLFAFNLLEGLLYPYELTRSSNYEHTAPPIITSYNSDYYNINFKEEALKYDNILSILASFRENHNIIGYFRTQNYELEFLHACIDLAFIFDFF